MSFNFITQYDSPNYTANRNGYAIDKIVIHHWGNEGQQFQNVVNWLCRSNGNSSAHYVVEDGKVACIVDCKDGAWHCGNFTENMKSIGIECRPEMTDGDLETVAELIAEIYKEYGILELYGHCEFQATACPGKYFAKLQYLKDRAIEILNGATPKESTNTQTQAVPDQVLTVGSKVKSIGLIAEAIDAENDLVYNSHAGGWIPCKDVDEVDTRDGACDQVLHVGSGFAFPNVMTVGQVDAVNDRAFINELGYWLNCSVLDEVEEGQ